MAAPDWAGIRLRAMRSASRGLALDRARENLAQAGLRRLPAGAWLGLRLGSSALAGAGALVVFGVPVLGLVGCLACHQLLGLALEQRRRRRQLGQQQALLEAVRHGAAVMSRGGSASDMLQALAGSGPRLARPVFAELVGGPEGSEGPEAPRSLPDRADRLRDRLAEPLFDDVALALALHWRRGARLVPALEAIAQDWAESVRLQRDAEVLRAGIEASVLVLTILPVVFLALLQALAPQLLQPFRTATGQALLGLAVLWMVLGYRVMQRMSEPPREERLRLRRAEP